MPKSNGGIKIVSNYPCDAKSIENFNRRIAEIISRKFSKEFISQFINETHQGDSERKNS
ncbi:MAG: hypothetical protein ABRQ27_00360 [Clostridiaceae bacterium]